MNRKLANGLPSLNNTPKDPAATTAAATYTLTTNVQSGTSPAGYTITCPGTHVGSTLAKIQSAGGASGSVCGAACNASKLEWVSTQGLQAAP